jgi:antitoxin CcdA
LGINPCQACERGLTAAVADAHRQRWLEANQGAMEAWNDHVAAHGLPLAAFRQF